MTLSLRCRQGRVGGPWEWRHGDHYPKRGARRIQRFTWWKTESFGWKYDSDERRSKEDELILKSLERTTCNVDRRYQVGLVWRDLNTNLPDNRAVAERRLHLLEKCLESKPDLNAKYSQTIDDDPQKRYIKKLSEKQSSEPTLRLWYLPDPRCYILTNLEKYVELAMQRPNITGGT